MRDPQQHAVAADVVFDGNALHRDAAVLVEGTRIVGLRPREDLPTDMPTEVLPRGAWLAPGFVDLQVNGGGDVLFNDQPTPDGIARIVAAHRRFGATSLLPTLISDTPEKMRAALAAVRAMADHPGVLGIHFEGPFLSPEKPGVHDPAMIRAPGAGDLELLLSLGTGATLVTLAPEQVPAGFIARLVEGGARVSLGHSMATYAQTKEALAAGLTGFTHLFNAMRPMESREPGPIAAALESSDASIGLIVDGVHVAPPMLRLALRGAAQPVLVTDAMPPAGGNSRAFTLQGRQVEAHGGHCMTRDGTLAGTALDMATAVRNCARMLGVPLETALAYASTAPARFLGLADCIGHLGAGCRADMVALDPHDVRVLRTWVAGEPD